MYSVIKEEKRIKKCQDIFEKMFQVGTNKYKGKKIGFRGGSKICNVYWSSKLEFWSTSTIRTNGGNRYLNWFGFTNPENNNNLSVDAEISISINGNRTAGKFVTDKKNIFIAHNGDFRKNGKRIKDIFMNYYKNNHKNISTVGGEDLVIIAELPSNEQNISEFQNKICAFIKEAEKIKNQKSVPQKTYSNTNNESSKMIAQRIKKIILKINRTRELNNKREIFDQAALFELWDDIENPCKSDKSFKDFSKNLYKLIREKTRYENPNKKNKDDPKYNFLLPKKFVKINQTTKHFWAIVNTLRHDDIHDEIGNIVDLYEEFLGKNKKSGPESQEDYLKLHIEVLKLFENSMKILLAMVQDDLNRPEKP